MINFVLGIFQLLSIIIVSIFEYNKRSVSIFLWATLLIMFGIPHFLSIMTATSGYNDVVMIKASIFVILFNILYLTTRLVIYAYKLNPYSFNVIKNINIEEKRSLKINARRTKKIKIISSLMLLLAFLVLIYSSLTHFGSLTSASWGNFRKISSELKLKNPLRYANLSLFGVAGIILVYLKEDNWKMALICSSLVVAYTLITGNRIIILPIVVSIILKYLYIDEKKINFKTIMIAGIAGFLIIYLVYFLRLLRIYGGFYNMITNNSLLDLNRKNIDMILNGDGELSLRKVFYHFIYYDNNFENFNRGHTYIRMLLVGIPTFLIPDIKPPDFAISMGSAWLMNPYNTTQSMHPTLYGDCFANLWWFGILLGIFWALFSFYIDKFIYKKNKVVKLMLMVLFSVMFVIVGRGSVYNGFFIAFVGTIIILLINLISRIRI